LLDAKNPWKRRITPEGLSTWSVAYLRQNCLQIMSRPMAPHRTMPKKAMPMMFMGANAGVEPYREAASV
jgi:hypothetical protein